MGDRFEKRRRDRRRAAVARIGKPSNARSGGYGMNDPAWLRARVTPRPISDEAFEAHATVFRCVTVLTNALVSAPLAEIHGPRTQAPRIVEDGVWQPLLDDPNPLQTQAQFVEGFGTYLLLGGEVGLYCEGENGPARIDEIPREVWPLPKHALEPIVDEKTKTLLGWKIATSGGQIDVPAHALTHLRFFNPRDPLRGLSPLSAAMTGLRSDMKAEAWGEAFFDNSAEPGGILSTDGALTQKQRDDMREAWESKHRTPDRAHRVAVLEGGLTYQQVGIGQRDMQFLEQRGWNETQIAKVYGVPKFFLMDATDISYASTRQNKRALWELAVLPLIAKIEDVFRVRLCGTRTGRNVRIGWDLAQVEALRDDLDAKIGNVEGLTRLGYPLNEANERVELGMKPQGWGDRGTLPMGVAPAEDVALGMTGGDDLYDDEPVDDEGDVETDPIPQEDKPKDEGDAGRLLIRVGETDDEGRNRRSAAWRALERGTMRPGVGKMKRRLRGFVNGRKGEVLKFLRDLKAGRASDDGYAQKIAAFLDEAEGRWQEQIARQTRPLYRQQVEAAAKGVGRELGGLQFFSAADPEVAAFLARKEVLVRGVPKTIAKALRLTLLEGTLQNEDLGSLQDRVAALSGKAGDVFRASMNRTLSIARTETAQTVNGARRVVMQAERVERTEWLTSDDEFVRNEPADAPLRVRPAANHRVLDGDVVPLGTSFVPGVVLRNPGDVDCSQAQHVVNCRCGAAAVR